MNGPEVHYKINGRHYEGYITGDLVPYWDIYPVFVTYSPPDHPKGFESGKIQYVNKRHLVVVSAPLE